MIALISWAVLVVEALAFSSAVLNLLQQSHLQGCGTCSICSLCYSNCGIGNLGFDQNNVLTSLCIQSSDSIQFWGCLCTTPPVAALIGSVSASLANCPTNYPNSTLSSVLVEFSVICNALGFPAPKFSVLTTSAQSYSIFATSTLPSQSTSTSSNNETSGTHGITCFWSEVDLILRRDTSSNDKSTRE
jgi:hypothetical protein